MLVAGEVICRFSYFSHPTLDLWFFTTIINLLLVLITTFSSDIFLSHTLSTFLLAPHLQRLWHTAFSTRRSSSFEFVPEHVLCGCDILNSRLWRFRARYMALTALYGDYDLRSTYSAADAGEYRLSTYIYL